MPDLIGACFHKTKVCDAVFSPDGRRVLTRTDGNEAYLWDYENSRLAAPALSHAGRVRHIAVNNGARLGVYQQLSTRAGTEVISSDSY